MGLLFVQAQVALGLLPWGQWLLARKSPMNKARGVNLGPQPAPKIAAES